MSLVMLLLPFTPGHLLSSVVTPINLTKSGLAAIPKRPHVLLFLHIGKCGGTTVRSIFQHAGGWVRPIWSITQRFSGWKANRMLHSLHSSMAQGAQKIFIEWHIVRNPPAPHLLAESPPVQHSILHMSHVHVMPTRLACACWQEPKFSDVPDIIRYARVMRPDVDIQVFTILRSPAKLIASTAVYFDPNTRCAWL